MVLRNAFQNWGPRRCLAFDGNGTSASARLKRKAYWASIAILVPLQHRGTWGPVTHGALSSSDCPEGEVSNCCSGDISA